MRSRSLLALLGIALALGLGWAGLRWLRPPACEPYPGDWLRMTQALLGHYREPCADFSYTTVEFDVRVRLNNFGLHAPDYTLDKPPGVFRVLLVGDSFPQGWQAPLESGFPWLLQAALNREANRLVEVINLSLDAIGTDRELLWYALLGWRFQPDLVVLSVYTGNDIQDNQIDLETRRYGYRLSRPFFTLERDGTLRLHNALPLGLAAWPPSPPLDWLALTLAAQTPAPPPNPPARPAVLSADPYDLEYPVELGLYLPEDAHWADAWALTEALLLQFRDGVAAQNIPLVVMILPDRRAVHSQDWAATLIAYEAVLPDLRATDPLAHTLRLEDFLAANGIAALNLAWTLRARAQADPDTRLFYPVDGHLTPAGHAVIADRLAGWLAAWMPG